MYECQYICKNVFCYRDVNPAGVVVVQLENEDLFVAFLVMSHVRTFNPRHNIYTLSPNASSVGACSTANAQRGTNIKFLWDALPVSYTL